MNLYSWYDRWFELGYIRWELYGCVIVREVNNLV